MGVFSFISNIFKPAADLIDNLTTTDEERMTIKKEMMKIENNLQLKILEYESQLLKAQSSIVLAEATGKSWLQRNWRPITMMCFLVIVLGDSFGLIHIAEERAKSIYTLLQIGLGGYVIGRSAEKIAPQFAGKNKSGEAKG
jgi:hypothetical protein